MLGHAILSRWQDRFDVFGVMRGKFERIERLRILERGRAFDGVDVRDEGSVRMVVEAVRPDVIFNAVGIIKQLPNSKNVVETLEINSIFPHRLAGLAAEFGARLVNVSTDCVFSGSKGMYTESDQPDALDLYGISKRFGEVAEGNCLTVRTSIIGPEIGSSHSLLDWFLGNEGGEVKGYSNAVFSGFPTVVLADILGDVIERPPDLAGLFHVSAEPIDKFTLLQLVRDAYGARIAIVPDGELVIDRSLDSGRFREATGFVPRPWPAMIREMAAADTRRLQTPENLK